MNRYFPKVLLARQRRLTLLEQHIQAARLPAVRDVSSDSSSDEEGEHLPPRGRSKIASSPSDLTVVNSSAAGSSLGFPAGAAESSLATESPDRSKSLSLVARNVLLIASDEDHDWASKAEYLQPWHGMATEDDVIHILENIKAPKVASHVFKWAARQEDFQHTVFTYNAYLNALVKGGQGSKARKVFDDMLYQECLPNIYTYGIVLRGLCDNAKTDAALELLQDMESKMLTPSSFIVNMLVSCLCKNGRVDAAYDLYKRLSDECSPDRISFNMLTYGLCKVDQIDRALAVFAEMEENGVVPSLLTYNGLLYGYSRSGRMEQAMALLEEMIEGKKGSDVVPDMYSYNTVINGFCKAGQLPTARYVLRRMIKSGCSPNVVTFNTLLDGLCLTGKLDEANAMFEYMVERKCEPTAVTYTVLITGHARALRLDKANDYFVDMLRRGVEPNVYTYTALIGGLCDANKVEDALEILKRMSSTGREPNVVTYTRVIGALCKGGQIERATKMFNDAMGSKTAKCKPDAYVYSTIIYWLCRQSKFLEAYEYFLRMVESKIVAKQHVYKSMADGLELIQETEKVERVCREASAHGMELQQKDAPQPLNPHLPRRKARKEMFLYKWEITKRAL